MSPLEKVLAAIDEKGLRVGAPSRRGEHACQCPAHADDEESLSVREVENGSVLIHCYAGCNPDAVLRVLSLGMSDLFPVGARTSRRKSARDEAKKATEKPVDTRILPSVPDDVKEFLSRKVARVPGPKLVPQYDYSKPVKKYFYVDEDGKKLICSERFETTTFEVKRVGADGKEDVYVGEWEVDGKPKKAKTFRQCRFAPNGWRIASLDGGWFEVKKKVWCFCTSDPDARPSAGAEWFDTARRVVYHLPQLRKAAEEGGRTAYIVEGEKDVESLERLGFVATCNPMGAGKWLPEFNLSFEGIATVIIWCDRDLPGYRHALTVRENLLPIVGDVRIVEGLEGKDATDHLDAGRHPHEFRSLSVDDVDARIAFLSSIPAPLPVTHKMEVGSVEPPAVEKGLDGPSDAVSGAFSDAAKFEHCGASIEGRGDWSAPWFAPFTDAGNAERIFAMLDGTVKFCAEREQWLTWDKSRWKFDRTGGAAIRQHVIYMARTMRDLNKDNEKFVAHCRSLESTNGVNNCVSMLKSVPGVPVVPDSLDIHPTVLPCANGVINLKTGQMIEPDMEMLLTRRIDVDYVPDAEAPKWAEFLQKAIPYMDYRRFLHRWIGYCLTGLTREQKLLFIYGPPRTGKSTLVQTITRIMSEYYETVDRKKLMMTRNAESEIPAWLAKLKGARLVTAVECKDSDRLDGSLVKIMTGNEDISARFLNQNEITYRPQFKLILTGNHRFQFEGDDSAIARRILEMTLDQTVDEASLNPDLDDELWEEREGILAWMVEGARLYFESGLCVPGDMSEKIKEYQKDMDFIGQFIEERLEVIEGAQMASSDLFKIYCDWAKDNNEWKMSQKAFAGKMRGRFDSRRLEQGVVYFGLRRRPEIVPM